MCFPLGVTEVQRELKTNYDSTSINEACTRAGNKIVMTCLQSTSSLQQFTHLFWTMTETFNSIIFQSIWFETMKNACHKNPSITISDVFPHVWEPTFANCQQLLEQLQDRSMSLSDVDKYFHQFKGEGLERELERLVRGIHTCCKQPKDTTWIHQAVKRIEKYWKLCGQREAAYSLLELRNTLKLTEGDFSVVERISSEVNNIVFILKFYNLLQLFYVIQVSTVLKNHQTLGDIDEELVSAGEFLSRFSRPKVVECIKKFIDCQDIVQWIKETTAGKWHCTT